MLEVPAGCQTPLSAAQVSSAIGMVNDVPPPSGVKVHVPIPASRRSPPLPLVLSGAHTPFKDAQEVLVNPLATCGPTPSGVYVQLPVVVSGEVPPVPDDGFAVHGRLHSLLELSS